MALQMKPYCSSSSSSSAAATALSFRPSVTPFISNNNNVSFQPSAGRRSKAQVVVAVIKKSPKRLKYSSPRLPKEDGLLYIEVDPEGSDTWKLDAAVELLKNGAVGVIPTDTVYAMVCDMTNHDAIERLRRLKEVETGKPFSILCRSLHDIDTYTTGFPRGNSDGFSDYFRAVKHCVPGPYTFILTASKALPKQCVKYGPTISKYASRKTLGVRIPDDAVCQAVLEKMGAPLISTSIRSPVENQWILDPVLIADAYGPEIPPKIIRQGKGPKQQWMVEEGSATEERD